MEIKWTEPAQGDLQEIEAFISEGKPVGAVQLVLEIIDHAEILRKHPTLGRVGRRKGTRELVFGRLPFVMIYRVRRRSNVIEILRVLHTARKWP